MSTKIFDEYYCENDELMEDGDFGFTFLPSQKEPETHEMRCVRLESMRRSAIKNMLTGEFNDKKFYASKVFAYLINTDFFSPKYQGQKPQDITIDARQNTALHYAIDPCVGGPLTKHNFTKAYFSGFLEEVIDAHSNPHLRNLSGATALDLIDDVDLVKMIEDATKTFRPDVYNAQEFAATYKRIEG